MTEATEMERRVTFLPAYDKRDSDPSKNYGVHGVDLRMVLVGPSGATQFILYTNWHLPHVTEDTYEHSDPETLCILTQPLPADLGFHWPEPPAGHEYLAEYEPQDCDVLPGGKCFYDGSGLNAEGVYHRLLTEGSDGVWAELTDYYHRLETGEG